MRFAHLALAASLTCAAPLQAQPVQLPEGLVKFSEFVTKVFLQTAVSAVRSQVEMTYDDIVLDLAAGRMAMTGLNVRPDLPWDEAGGCAARVDAIEIFSPAHLDVSKGRIEIVGLDLPLACLPPDPQGMILAAGYERLQASSLAIDFDYRSGSSALDLAISGVVQDAIAIDVAAEFAYFWFQTPGGIMGDVAADGDFGGAPDAEPVADLAFAEITLADIGLLERAGPMLGAMIGGFETVPPMVEGMILQQLGPDGQVFAGEMRGSVEAFLAGEEKLVLTIAPDAPIRLSPDLFEDPATLFAALDPSASGRAAAETALIDRALLDAALNGQDMSDEDRLILGEALATGVGAPLSAAAAREVLAPLADAGHPEAAMIASQSYGADEVEEAYALALIAAAGGADGALSRLDRLEAGMPFDQIASSQQIISEALPSDVDDALNAAFEAGDLVAIREFAILFDRGADVPRNYSDAYFLATLAAAGGDRGAAALRDRIDARLSRRGAGSEGWADARSLASTDALREWVDGGLLDRLAQ